LNPAASARFQRDRRVCKVLKVLKVRTEVAETAELFSAFRSVSDSRRLYRSVQSVTVGDLESTLASLTASVEALFNQRAAA
jgi:hypothetical protein